jgi:four helix bundle protein
MNQYTVGYHKLAIWKEAHTFILLIYPIINTFPKYEVFCLVSQIRRAAISVPANIAEGHSRRTTKEFIQFLTIANGSLVEVEYYLELSRDLKYISDTEYKILNIQREKIGRLLHFFIKSLRERNIS